MFLSTKFDYSKVQFDKSNDVHLLINAKAPKIDLKDSRKPIFIIAAIDESGSMQGQKIEYAKKSLMKMVDHLSGVDKLGVIAFTDGVRTIFSSELMVQEKKEQFKNKINDLCALSMTNFSGAVLEAFAQAGKTDGSCRVILFTDGQPTSGETNLDRILELVKNKPGNVTVSAFGYGDDHDSNFLTEVAKLGDGNYYYVKNPDDALSAFARELGGLLSCYAQNLTFTLMPNDSGKVKVEEVLSDANVEELDGGAVRIKVPDLYSEETRKLLFSIKLEPQPKCFPRSIHILDISLEWDGVQSGERKSIKEPIKIEYVKEKDVQKDPDKEVVDQLALAKIMKAQEEATVQARAGNFAAAGSIMSFCMQDAFVQQADASIRQVGSFASCSLSSSAQFTANSHNLSANKSAYRKGRGAGGISDSGVYGVDNSFQEELISDFTLGMTSVGVTGSAGPVGVPSNLDHAWSTKIDPKIEEKKLEKKKSKREW